MGKLGKREMSKVEKFSGELKSLLDELNFLDDLSLVYNGKMESYGSSKSVFTSNDDVLFLAGEMKETQRNVSDWSDCEDCVLVILFDGGFMYSAAIGEFGWSTWDKFETRFSALLDSYNYSQERIDNVSIGVYKN